MIGYKDIMLTVGKAIQAVDMSRIIVIKGVILPSLATAEEWIAYEYLGNNRIPAPVSYKNENIDIQITLYCRHAENRVDKKYARLYEMLDLYLPLFDGNTTCFTGGETIQWQEPRHTIIDLHSVGAVATTISEKSPQLKALCAVILCNGIVIQSK